MVVARRRSALRAAGPDLEVGEVEILRPQKVGLDLQAGVVRHHFLLQGLEDDAEALELALVALELAPDRLAGLLVSPHPGGLVVLHLAQDFLSRHRIVVIQQERDEVEPALGLGQVTPSRHRCPPAPVAAPPASPSPTYPSCNTRGGPPAA